MIFLSGGIGILYLGICNLAKLESIRFSTSFLKVNAFKSLLVFYDM